VDWVRLAVALGYSDQMHFIKEFKAIVGKTPAEYGGRRM
jgi:AraC-like DNA-binding protein